VNGFFVEVALPAEPAFSRFFAETSGTDSGSNVFVPWINAQQHLRRIVRRFSYSIEDAAHPLMTINGEPHHRRLSWPRCS
jgi:hypothetical protein